MIARIPESPPLCLADAMPGDLVQVRLIVFELVRSRCWHLPLREGDTLRFIDADEDSVTVARLDGSHLFVPADCARFIGVRRLQGHEERPRARPRAEPRTEAADELGPSPARWGR